MPRAIDPLMPEGGLPLDHNPLNTIQYNVIPNPMDLLELLQQIVDGFADTVRDFIFPAIEQLTGIDLSVFLPLFDVLDLDFSSPEAFLESLVGTITALPAAITQILIGVINELTGPDGEEQLTELIASIIALLVELPTLLIDLATGLLGANTGIASIFDIFEAITGLSLAGSGLTDLTEALTYALQNIPFLNVTGIGGPPNLGYSIQNTWNQIVGGFVGAIGVGTGLADLFNIANMVSSNATLGQFSWDILGIRTNKSLNTGLLPTSESNIGLDKVALAGSAPTFAVTQSTAITAFQRISEAASKGVVSWLGSGITSITHFFVNIYQMDTSTGDMTLVHSSANIAGDLSGTMQYNVYDITPPLAVEAGEVYGIELALRGAGTHSVVGSATWLPDHPTVFPKRLSALRNSGTSAAPSTIASGSVVYTSNVPFMEFGVTSGDLGVPHSPQLILFNSVGATTIVVPTWCETVQVIAIGGGGGGAVGGFFTPGGPGGGPGSWATATWIRGTDFTSDVTINITVPSGGSGSNGSAAVVTNSGHTVTAAGGLLAGSTGQFGVGAGDQVYDSITYVGGGQQDTQGAAGAAPGGGGASGEDLFVGAGGAGASGAVWIRFVQ